MSGLDFTDSLARLDRADSIRVSGRVTDVIGLVIEAILFGLFGTGELGLPGAAPFDCIHMG